MRLSGPSPCPRAQGQASDRACAAPATSSSTPWANRPMRRPSCEKDRKSTRLNSSHLVISYAVFCLKKKTEPHTGRSKGFGLVEMSTDQEAAHAIHQSNGADYGDRNMLNAAAPHMHPRDACRGSSGG